MDTFKDFQNVETHVGDKVIYMCVGYRNLLRGTVISISNQKALIKHEHSKEETRQFHTQIIKQTETINKETDNG